MPVLPFPLKEGESLLEIGPEKLRVVVSSDAERQHWQRVHVDLMIAAGLMAAPVPPTPAATPKGRTRG